MPTTKSISPAATAARIALTVWSAARKPSRRCSSVTRAATLRSASAQSSAESPPPATITRLPAKRDTSRTA
jgi:hypothetical protein